MNIIGKIVAIDPGPETSGMVVATVRSDIFSPIIQHAYSKIENDEIIRQIERGLFVNCDFLLIEKVESYGMAVGRDVFETVYQSGRIHESWRREVMSPSTMMILSRIARFLRDLYYSSKVISCSFL